MPAATQIISNVDYQQKEFWMGIETDLDFGSPKIYDRLLN